MTNTQRKNRTHCKCRIWERDRRNRLSNAFTELATILPTTPTTTPKIAILQKSIKYIKELHEKIELLQGQENKNPDKSGDLLEKFTLLEEQCSQLMEYVQSSGLPMPKLATAKPKSDNSQLSPSNIVQDITNKINQDDKNTPKTDDTDNIQESGGNLISNVNNLNNTITIISTANQNTDEVKVVSDGSNVPKKYDKKSNHPKQKSSKKKSKKITNNCCNGSNLPLHSAVKQKNNTINNVWVTHTNQNAPLMLGNALFPFVPIASPVLMASTQQTPTFFLVQRPTVNNNFAKELLPGNTVPIIKQVTTDDRLMGKIYPNSSGFDVTKTTMVNKVPISAFSSSVSNVKSKRPNKPGRILRVTQRMRSISIGSRRAKKTIVQESKNNKENIAENSKGNDKENAEPKPDKSGDASTSSNEQQTDQNPMDQAVTAVEKSGEVKDAIKDVSADKNDLFIENQQLDFHDTIGKEVSSDIVTQINAESNSGKNDEQFTAKDFLLNSANKSDCNLDKSGSSKSVPQDDAEKSSDTNNKLKMIVQTYEDVDQNLMDQSRDECKITSLKNVPSSSVMGHNDIPEDLLDSFDGAPEQTLPTSPLAASPTAAFLLAFPLVCPGPRPDTPLNDNLQTPNMCSLDNFSTFFAAKESAAANNSVNNSHMFSDCSTKQNDKKNWPNAKTLPEIKYPMKSDCPKIGDLDKVDGKLPTSTSAACVYSDQQSIFQNSKLPNVTSHYGAQDNLYNYEILPLYNQKETSNMKDNSINEKLNINFGNNLQNVKDKNETSNYLDAPIASCNKPYINPLNDTNSCKKSQPNDSCMKLVLPRIIPDLPVTKASDVPFGLHSQSKSLHNSSNIYTSCNTYNPFSSDFTPNSVNLSITCGNSLNTIRSKPTTSYFPDFNSSNIYTQNCGIWTEDNQNEFDSTKVDYNRKLNLPTSQNQTINATDFQSDLRFTLPVMSKSSANKHVVADKNLPKNKFNKDVKYSNDKNKSDFTNQKGLVNWMTSDTTVQQNPDIFFPNYKDIKHEQNLLLTNSSQCLDSSSNLSGITSTLNCKKSDLFEQPFFHLPPSSYVSQVINEDNQFTWSPSKLNTFSDNLSLPPCTLPTLVGDLALGIGTESKLGYQGNNVDESNKDRKILHQKPKETFVNKPNCNQNVEMNTVNGSGQFFSVSQLMDRGKATNAIDNNCKPTLQDKRSVDDQDRHYNQLNAPNKAYDGISHCASIPIFPTEYPTQSHIDNSISTIKDANFENKIDIKNTNKNNYSTEALLQNNSYQNNRKYKQNFNMQRIYGDNSNYSLSSNQFISSNHPLQFDNFSQNQQYGSNTFPYSNPSATVNSSFYSSTNFMSSANTMGSTNYIGNGFSSDLPDFHTGSDNIIFPTKIDTCKLKPQADFTEAKYSNAKMTLTKDVNMKTKSDGCVKKETIKRQKKSKPTYSNNYGVSDKCFNPSNQINSPMGIDDSFFGYSTGQMHSYPQPGLLPNIQLAGSSAQKNLFSVAKPNMSSPPNAVGNSLTSFNLSAIFPEINKRTTMPGFSEPQLPPTSHAKSGLFH